MQTLKISMGYKHMQNLIGNFFPPLHLPTYANEYQKKRQLEPEICLQSFYTHVLDVLFICHFFNEILEISAMGSAAHR